jgi:hypothetical protein
MRWWYPVEWRIHPERAAGNPDAQAQAFRQELRRLARRVEEVPKVSRPEASAPGGGDDQQRRLGPGRARRAPAGGLLRRPARGKGRPRLATAISASPSSCARRLALRC